MTLTIGPSIRAQLSSTTLPSSPTAPQRSPAFGDLLAMRGQEERDSQPQSFAATGMLGKGMRAVEERVNAPASHDNNQRRLPSDEASGSVSGANISDMRAARVGPLRIDLPGQRPLPHITTSVPATRTDASNGGGIADRPLSSARPLASDEPEVRSPRDASSVYRNLAGGSETPVQFAAQLSEAGVRVFARLSPLDVVERDRLRSAIASMLAEYGALADDITLSEVPYPSERIAGSGSNGR